MKTNTRASLLICDKYILGIMLCVQCYFRPHIVELIKLALSSTHQYYSGNIYQAIPCAKPWAKHITWLYLVFTTLQWVIIFPICKWGNILKQVKSTQGRRAINWKRQDRNIDQQTPEALSSKPLTPQSAMQRYNNAKRGGTWACKHKKTEGLFSVHVFLSPGILGIIWPLYFAQNSSQRTVVLCNCLLTKIIPLASDSLGWIQASLLINKVTWLPGRLVFCIYKMKRSQNKTANAKGLVESLAHKRYSTKISQACFHIKAQAQGPGMFPGYSESLQASRNNSKCLVGSRRHLPASN